jgi:hypothetical protein
MIFLSSNAKGISNIGCRTPMPRNPICCTCTKDSKLPRISTQSFKHSCLIRSRKCFFGVITSGHFKAGFL